MIFCLRFSNVCVCSSLHSHSSSFFNSCLGLSVWADMISMYLDRYWMAPRNDLSSFSLLGHFKSFIAISLSCSGLIPFWSIQWPIYSISVLKNSDLFSQSLYSKFYSRVRMSFSSFLCCSFEPLVTTFMSADLAGCLFSSVWSIFSS